VHLTIVALGSTGDVLPVVALGRALAAEGNRVRVAAYRAFAELVGRHGLEFAPVAGDPRKAMEDQPGQLWLESGRNPVLFLRRMRSLSTYEGLRQSLDDIVAACHGTRAVLYTVLGAAGYHVAERMGVPSVYLLLQPMTRSHETPSLIAPVLPLGRAYNWLTHVLAEQMLWQVGRATFNRWRSESLGLDPMPVGGPFDHLYQTREPFVYGFSQHVVPRQSDWPDWHYVTGYWFLEGARDWVPPPDLAAFLAQGPKPIAIGFGSMSGSIARQLAPVVVDAVVASGQRAVLLGGWSDLHDRELPPSICALESAPHDWLFPRMTAAVHHGGAGTTAAGLRAGVPSVVTPFFGDQPFWGRRVHALGVGPKPIMRSHLTARRLQQAIDQAVTDRSMQDRAAVLGERIRSEDGVARAVEVIAGYLRG
jgi:UDP:flavonoid glycosyltransferase YjiC (YdhE family)